MKNQSKIVHNQEQEYDSAWNLDKGKKANDIKQEIDGEYVLHKQLVEVKSQMSDMKTMILDIKEDLLLSPYPCFISLLYLDLYVLGDDALIS